MSFVGESESACRRCWFEEIHARFVQHQWYRGHLRPQQKEEAVMQMGQMALVPYKAVDCKDLYYAPFKSEHDFDPRSEEVHT